MQLEHGTLHNAPELLITGRVGVVEAGGVGIFTRIENTQLIDFSRRQKRGILGNCAELERIWNAEFLPAKRNFRSTASLLFPSRRQTDPTGGAPASARLRIQRIGRGKLVLVGWFLRTLGGTCASELKKERRAFPPLYSTLASSACSHNPYSSGALTRSPSAVVAIPGSVTTW